MEASAVANIETPPEPVATFNGGAEATRSTGELFQWSKHVHVGTGAAECEHGRDGKCEEPLVPLPEGGVMGHFHAWVCLPNTFQIRDIGDKARAAKARKKRALRDPESDSYAVLEDELDDLRRDNMAAIVESAAKSEVEKYLGEIVESVRNDERFEHQDQDAEEFRRLQEMDEADRDTEEFDRLQKQMLAYGELFEQAVAEREEKERAALQDKPEEAVEIERRARIEHTSTEVYLHTYYTWAIFIGTRKPVADALPLERVFRQPDDLKFAPPEVVLALRDAIRDLEDRPTERTNAAGNS